jgi:small conductance mechanosensitive channel
MDALIDLWTQLPNRFPIILNWVGNAVAALLILVLGVFIGRFLSKRFRRSTLGGAHLDKTLRPVLASAVFYVILAMTVYAVLIRIGVPATSLIAVFGAAGLAIGLALRDTLANVAAGVMLLILRPLEVGDFVSIGSDTEGSIEQIDLFTTTIRNSENVAIFLPNSLIWGNRIQNFGRHAQRKANVTIGVGYDTDLDHAKTVLMSVLKSQDGLIPFADATTHKGEDKIGPPTGLSAPTPPEVYVMGFGESAITMSCRCWLPADGWLMRMSRLRMDIKRALDKAEIDIPFPQRVVHVRPEASLKPEVSSK